MEPLTQAQVTPVLRRHLGSTATCTGLARGPIGNGQETWFVDVTVDRRDRELVLRRTAEAGPLEWTDRGAETRAMAAAAAAGLPVPTVHWVTGDPEELGAAYMVMDRAPGSSAMQVRGPEREALAADLARHLARLHAAGIPDPEGRDAAQATRDEVERWRRHYADNRVAAVPLVDALLAWLAADVPAGLADVPAIALWGDAGAHNALGRDGAVSAMLDWELAHAGHPLEDLASAMWVDQGAGVDPAVLVEAYEAASGTTADPAAIAYFLAMTCVTRSLMIIVGAGAFVRGRTHAPTLAGLGLDLPVGNLALAAEHAGWGSLPAPAAPLAVPPVGAVLRPTGPEIDVGVAAFLRAEVLPAVTDARTRRGLKTAAALLETAAVRARSEPAVTEARDARTAALLAELVGLGVHGDLAVVAAHVESDPALADLRPQVRAHLLQDLADQRALLAPLHRLYHP